MKKILCLILCLTTLLGCTSALADEAAAAAAAEAAATMTVDELVAAVGLQLLGLLYFFACKGAPGAFHVASRLVQLLPEHIQLSSALLHRLAGMRKSGFHA